MSQLSVVYVVTNPAMPGLVKIGRTTQEDAQLRIGQLYSIGVPFPFQLEFACRVLNPDEVEQALHAEQYRSRRPNINFEEMGIPIGSELNSIGADATVIVVGPKKVRLGFEEMSLTAATRQVLGLNYSVAPGPYWSFNGRLLHDIYNETYREAE